MLHWWLRQRTYVIKPTEEKMCPVQNPKVIRVFWMVGSARKIHITNIQAIITFSTWSCDVLPWSSAVLLLLSFSIGCTFFTALLVISHSALSLPVEEDSWLCCTSLVHGCQSSSVWTPSSFMFEMFTLAWFCRFSSSRASLSRSTSFSFSSTKATETNLACRASCMVSSSDFCSWISLSMLWFSSWVLWYFCRASSALVSACCRASSVS